MGAIAAGQTGRGRTARAVALAVAETARIRGTHLLTRLLLCELETREAQ